MNIFFITEIRSYYVTQMRKGFYMFYLVTTNETWTVRGLTSCLSMAATRWDHQQLEFLCIEFDVIFINESVTDWQ